MDFLIKNTKGLTLKTKGKYCTEDLVIEIDPSLVEGYMEIDELPEVGLPRVLYKLMLEEPEYYIWENEEWVQLNTKGGGGSATVTRELTGGEPIPNTGTLSEIYLNTDLSVEEVVEILSQLTYLEDGTHFVAVANDMSFAFGVMQMQGIYLIGELTTETIYFASQDIGYGITGWNTSLINDKKITLSSEVTLASELEGIAIGSENELLRNVIAISDFAVGVETVKLSGNYDGSTIEIDDKQLDIKALIENDNKIPLTVKMSSNYVKPDGTLSITENGTHDVSKYANVEVNVAEDKELIEFLRNTPTSVDFENSNITNLRMGAFAYVQYNSITLPNLTYVSSIATFKDCQAKNINVDNLTNLQAQTFAGCSRLTSIKLPSVKSMESTSQFYGCLNLKTIDFSVLENIPYYAFYQCNSLTSLIIRSETVCALETTDAFQMSAIESGTGYIYVPDDLVESYKTTTGWSTYASQIKPLSEYVEE